MRYISSKSFHKSVKYWVSGAATLALLPGIVFAQNTQNAEGSPEPAKEETFEPAAPANEQLPDAKPSSLEEVVVTGTQMRGVAPTGAQLISMDIQSIAATGAVTTAELMATVPQNIGFGALPSVGATDVQLTVNRVNLRNLPQGVGAASPTLVLMDGHRLVGVGISQNYPDPDVVPPGMLQRVEILTEGGSSVYGADAIGGVVNFITRKDIDGAEVGVRQGFGDSYNSTDVNVTAGSKWGDTSAYGSYSLSHNDQINGGNRNYVKKIDWTTGVPVDLACNPANVTIGPNTWAVNPQSNTLTPGTSNKCDTTKYDSIYPRIERNSVFAGLTHDFTDRVQLDLQTWYTKRDNTSDEGPLEGTTSVQANNPNYISTGGATAAATQNVGFNFSPINGNHQSQNTNLEEWGFTPTLRWDIGHEWQMRAYYNYGYSNVDFRQQEVNSVALNEAVAAGTLNPYNIVASDPAAIATVLNRYQTGRGKQEMNDAKTVFDGPVYQLPGGQVHFAVGAEYLDEYYKGGTLTDVAGVNIPYVDANRDVHAWFAEVNIPVVGDSNKLPGIYEITLAASYRYDDYSDFGSADSPNYAFTYKPLEWLSLRGRYNEAFQAPGLADLANANSTVTTFSYIPGIIANPAVPVQPGQWLLAAQGTKLPLDPQTSQNYNVGFDIDVPFIEGFTIGASYYHIEYEGQISIPPIYNPGVFYPNYPSNYLMLPTNQQAAAYLIGAGVPQGDVNNALAQVGNNPLYEVADVRRINQGKNTFGGYDLFLQYDVETSFGSIFSSFNGTYLDNAKNQQFDGAAQIQNAGIDGSRFNATFGLGAKFNDGITVQGTLYHTSDYDLSTPAQLNQTKVDSWDTLDLYAQYDFPGDNDWTENLSLTVGVNNVTDEDPPEYHGVSSGNTSGYVGGTLGRVLQVGFNKRF